MQSTRFVEDKAFKKRAPAENNVLAEVGLARCCRSWMFVPRSFTDASWTSLQVAWAAERGRLKVLSFGLDLGQNAARSRVHASSVVGIAGLHGRLCDTYCGHSTAQTTSDNSKPTGCFLVLATFRTHFQLLWRFCEDSTTQRGVLASSCVAPRYRGFKRLGLPDISQRDCKPETHFQAPLATYGMRVIVRKLSSCTFLVSGCYNQART